MYVKLNCRRVNPYNSFNKICRNHNAILNDFFTRIIIKHMSFIHIILTFKIIM